MSLLAQDFKDMRKLVEKVGLVTDERTVWGLIVPVHPRHRVGYLLQEGLNQPERNLVTKYVTSSFWSHSPPPKEEWMSLILSVPVHQTHLKTFAKER